MGFWSYVHKDNQLDFERIADLARDIVANYEAIRGEGIQLFLDSDELQWGDKWREKIDRSLSNVAFFVPVLTPRFFQSVECRRELQFFLDQTEKLGIPQLVLPILYMDVPALADEFTTDPLVIAVRERQWRSWTELRFAERSSGEYRQAVYGLASEIADRVGQAESTTVVALDTALADVDEDDEQPGFIDLVAELETAMPRWNSTLEGISAQVQTIGQIMRSATEDMGKGEKSGKGFAARLVIARRVASELEDPVARIESHAQDWVKDLDSVDAGVRALMSRIPETYLEDAATTTTFLRSIANLSRTANQGLGSTQLMADSLEQISTQSRDLRPVVRRLRRSLVSMGEAREITDSWLALVEETGIDYSE